MKTELLNSTKLKITFDIDDLMEYGLSFEELDYSNQKTRMVLQSALALAKQETGFDCTGGRLFIEVFPERKGGCSAMFTKLPIITEDDLCILSKGRSQGRTYSFSKDYGLCLFLLKDFNDLSDCVKSFNFSLSSYLSSDLYLYNKEYYLLLHLTGSGFNRDVSVRHLCEYGEEIAKPYLMKSFLDEHAQKLFSGGALETLRV